MRAFVEPYIFISISRWIHLYTPPCGSSNSVTSRVTCSLARDSKCLGLDSVKCNVSDIREQLKRRGYTPTGVRTKAGVLGELIGLVRAEGFAPPHSVEGNLRQRRNQHAGFVDRTTMETGPRGFPLCRFCQQETPSKMRTFCSNGCVHEHKIRSQGSYVRKCLSTRDGGQCAECGADAGGLYKRARQAWISEKLPLLRTSAVVQAVAGTPFEGMVPRAGSNARPTSGEFWHADHIVPVVLGGGQCGLNNFRTLCVPCHKASTKRLARERALSRRREAQGGSDRGGSNDCGHRGTKQKTVRVARSIHTLSSSCVDNGDRDGD